MNGENEQMIYHTERAKRGLYFSMVEVDVEKLYHSSEDILLQVRRGYLEEAQRGISKSVDTMRQLDYGNEMPSDKPLAH